MMIDIAAQRFGRLIAVEPTERRTPQGNVIWLCQCDCGNIHYVSKGSLVQGVTGVRSCGCLYADTHRNDPNAQSKTPEYQAWVKMRFRCRNPKAREYSYYGGRGISICERWNHFSNFLADMGPRPSPEHSIDRKDNDGNYGPDNCRWATRSEQQQNQRRQKAGCFIGVNHRLDCVSRPWAARINPAGRTVHLGYFATAEQAAHAYDTAAVEAFGPFAKTNFIVETRDGNR
jgi:hypothetical protein